MQRFIYFFMIFALTLATDVSVYNSYHAFYRRYDIKPEFESAVPWKFGFTLRVWLHMAPIYYINPSPSVTKVNVTYESDHVTFNRDILTLSYGIKVPVYFRQLSGPEAIINLNLYTSNGLCRSIRVAEGKVVSEKSEKEYKYTDICFKGFTNPCVLLVDLKDVICKGPSNVTQNNENLKTTMPLSDLENNNTPFVYKVSLSSLEIVKTSTNRSASNTGPSNVTQKNENLKTTTPLTDLENNNTTFVYNVSSSPHENMKTSTNSSATNTDVKTTDNTVIIIVGSLAGITLILLAIILLVIWIRCRSNHSPQGTSDLPTNQNH